MQTRTALRKTIFAGTLIAFMVIICLCIPVRIFAADFTAKSLGDYGNVTVMEIQGSYDADNPDGPVNAAPRQVIAQEFFKTHKDEYDFLVIFTNFDFQMPEDAKAKAFYEGVKNDTQGIGQNLFDTTGLYGSNGKLQGTVDMGNLSGIITDPLNPKFEETLYVLSHELMHRWGAYIQFKDVSGNLKSTLLGRDKAHWSFLLDTGSVMYGNQWQDNGNGTFTSMTPQNQILFYSPMDLYLMGMIDKSKVPPMLLIDSPNTDSTQLSQAGVTVTGTAQYITIDQIIAAMGPRVPDASSSQKSFKTAFILITQPGTFTGNELYGIENIRNAEVTRLSILTDGQGIMEVASTPKENIPTNPGVIITPTTPRVLPPNINDGVQWLMTNQKPDGSWTDLDQTIERDTAEATLTLKNFTTTQANYQSGILWLGGMSSGNMDFLSRKIQALSGSGQDLTSLVNDVLSRQNSDGGWGSDKNYASNPMDTALAVKALTSAGFTGQQAISAAIGYLKAGQNFDGGWGTQDQGSTVQETSNVLSAFNQNRTVYQLDDAITRGTALLVSRQNSDGGFGDSPSTVYDSARAAMTLSELNISADITNKALAYLLGQQSDNGSWSQSAYQTALAIGVVYKDTVDPDLSIKPEDISFIPANITSLPSNIVINANVKNLGQTGAQAKVVLFDGDPANGNKLGEQTLMFPGLSSTTVTFASMIKDASEYRFTIVVDPDNLVKESNKLNNIAVKILSVEATYDFEVLSSDLTVSANPADMLQNVVITAKITNKGTMNAYNVQVKYYIDDPVNPLEIATQTIDIPAGATITKQTTWRANKAGVNIQLTVFADPFNNFTELSETNNKASTPITVNGATAPNLSVSYKDMVITPSPANQGGNANITALIKNDGFSSASNVQVNFYEGVPGVDGVLLGSQIVPNVNPGGSSQVSISWMNIKDSGEKIIYVKVDPDNQITEIRNDDNDTFTTVTILTLSDLTLSNGSITFSPATPKEGDGISVIGVVQNKGQQGASNILVTAYEGTVVLGTQIIQNIAGNSQATATIACNSPLTPGVHQITVIADPDNSILEQSKDNNSASKTLAVQSADLWITEQCFSPNGDGVKDSTQFSFRLQAPQTVRVLVVNSGKGIVRTFSGPDFEDTAAGIVTWDGFNDTGTVVDDGQYQMQVVNNGGSILASMLVTVDTNRSPIGEALGTQYMVIDDLLKNIPGSYTGDFEWQWLAYDSGILARRYSTNPDHVEYPRGLYTMSPDGNDIVALLPSVWMLDMDPQYSYYISEYHLSPTGEQVAFIVTKTNKISSLTDWNNQTQLWVVNTDGSNLKMIVGYNTPMHLYTLTNSWGQVYYSYSSPVGDYYTLQGINWSPDGKHLLYQALHYKYSPNDGTESFDFAEIWLSNSASTDKFKIDTKTTLYYYLALWSPNGQRILYQSTDGSTIYLVSLDATKTMIDTFDPNKGGIVNYWWSPDSSALAYTLRSDAAGSLEWKLRVNDVAGTRDIVTSTGGDYYNEYVSLNGWTKSNKVWVSNGAPSYRGLKLLLIDIATGKNSLMTEPIGNDGYYEWHSPPVISPDGHYAAFYTEGEYVNPANLYLADGDGNLNIVYSKFFCDGDPNCYFDYWDFDPIVWSPDSKRIAFLEMGDILYYSPWSDNYYGPYFDVMDIQSKQTQTFDMPGHSSDYHNTLSRWLSDNRSLVGVGELGPAGWFDSTDAAVELLDAGTGRISTIAPNAMISPSLSISPLEHYIPFQKVSCYNYTFCGTPQAVPTALYVASFYQNLVADLRVTKKSSFIKLSGIAQDINFDSWKLEYAEVKTPTVWNVIVPSANAPVMNDTFAAWTPPYEGAFYVKLTAMDKAGNVATSRKRVTWGQSSASITSLYKSADLFSPNGDGILDTVDLNYTVLEPVHLEFSIFDSGNNLVRTFYKDYPITATDHISWDGKDETGNIVPDGKYAIRIFDYEFFVEVDNSPPDVSLALSSLNKNGLDISAVLTGHAVDKNLKRWVIEYGIGENPQDWYAYSNGEKQIANLDSYGKPIGNPVQDIVINTFKYALGASTATDFSELSFLVGKKFRITAEDRAGNKRTIVTNFLEEKIVFDRYISKLGQKVLPYQLDVNGKLILPLQTSYLPSLELIGVAQKKVGGLQTVRTELVKMIIQYRSDQKWYDSTEYSGPISVALWIDWIIPKQNLDALRIKAIDSFGAEHYSNEMLVDSHLEIVPTEFCNYYITNRSNEDFQSLKVQMRSINDSRYAQWTDIKVYNAPGVPIDSWNDDYPFDLIPGMSYSFKLTGVGTSGLVYTTNPTTILFSNSKCLKLSLNVTYPEKQDCGTLSGTAKITAKIESNYSTIEYFNALSYYIQKPAGREQSGQFDLTKDSWNGVTLNTTDLSEGSYPVTAVLTYVKAGVAEEKSVGGTVVVDRVLPTAHLTYPSGSSLSICPVTMQGGLWQGISVEAVATDNTSVARYELYYGPGDNPVVWLPALDPAKITRDNPSGHIKGNGSAAGTIGTWNVSNLQGGTYSLKLKVVDAAGNISCNTAMFSFDTPLGIKSLQADKIVFSPNNDDAFDKVTINYEIGKYSTVNLNVYKLISMPADFVLDSAPLRSLAVAEPYLGGTTLVVWDGKDNSGLMAPDGLYGVTVSAKDSCGNTALQWVAVEIDNTPPKLAIDYPYPGSPLGNIVEIKGITYDPHFQTFTLEVGQGEVPDTWSTISTGKAPTLEDVDGILGRWNNFGLDGKWTLRLTAIDQVGNKNSTTTLIDLGTRLDLIKSLSAEPYLFTPNNDGKLDTTTIQYELTAACDVRIEIAGVDGVAKKTWYSPAVSSGAHSVQWDGTGVDGALLPDGAYRVKLTAALSSVNFVFETETVTVAMDTAAPVIDIAKPVADSYVRNDITLTGSITDASLSEYSVLMTGPTGTVLQQMGVQPRTNYVFAILNALPDSVYSIDVKAKDLAENITEKNITFTVDKTAPVITIDALKNGGCLGGENAVADISASISEKNLDTFSLRYGAGDPPSEWTELTNGTAIPASQKLYSLKVGPNDTIPDGVYTISLVVTDKAGSVTEARVKLIIDNTAPTVSIASPKECDIITAPTDIAGTASDPNLSAYIVEMSAGQCGDAYQWMTIKTVSASIQNGPLASWQALPLDGTYCVRVTATDKSGNTAQAAASVKVLTHPPMSSVLSGSVVNKSTANLLWSTNTEPDLAGYNLYRNGLKINTAILVNPLYLDQNLIEGVYAYTVRAVNTMGLESPSSNEVDIKIDLTGPEARIGSPQNGSKVSGLVDVKGTANSADDFRQYRVYVGQGAVPSAWTLIRTSPIPISYGLLVQWDTLGLAEGQPCTIKLEAEDLSGNISSSQSTVSIDNTPPSVPQLISATASSSDVTISWQANTDQDLAGYLLYRNDQLANGMGTVIGNLKPFYLQGAAYVDKSLPDGKFVYYLIAVDQAGNMSDQSNSLYVTIDTHPPHAVITDPIDNTVFEHKIMVKGESTDIDIASVQFQYQNSQATNWTNFGAPITAPPYTSYFNPSGLGLAYNSFRLRAVAVDQGQKTDPAPSFITVTYTDLTPPGSPQGLTVLTNGNKATITWSANTESDMAGYNIYRTVGTWRAKINAALIAAAAQPVFSDSGLTDGAYTYEVTSVDTHGNESIPSGSASAMVYAPVLKQSYTPTNNATIQISGTNAVAGATVSIFMNSGSSLTSLGTATADTAGNFTTNLVLILGENRITARATDNAGNTSRDSEMTVVVYDAAPASPTGLVATVQDHDVQLAWNANVEADISGYNLYRDGVKVNASVPQLTATVSASSTYDPSSMSPAMAFDGDPSTCWMSAGSAGDFTPKWLEIDLPSPELISRVDVQWGTGNFLGQTISPGKDFEVQVWSGYAWITQAAVRGNMSNDNGFDFKPSCRTDKIRIYITSSVDSTLSKFIRISEINVIKDNLVISSSAPVYDDMNLKDKKYTYAVTAVDYYGFESAPSDLSEATVGDVTAPAAPQSLTATAVGSAVALSWSSNTEADLAGYSVYRNLGQNWIKINSSLIGNMVSTYMDSGLLNGAYSYRLTAVDRTGNESLPSNEASAMVNAALPKAPTGLEVTAPQNGRELDVFWAASDSAAVGYNLYRGTKSGGPYAKLNSSGLISTFYNDLVVLADTDYYYVATSIDSLGNESPYSMEASGITYDVLAPAKPVIYSPTNADTPLIVSQNNITVLGKAEPLSFVKLFMDGKLQGSTRALDSLGDKAYSLQPDVSQVSLTPDEQILTYFTSDWNSAPISSWLWLQSLATGEKTSMKLNGYCVYPKWSPDGNILAYESFDNNWVPRIWVYDRRTGTSKSLNADGIGREYDQSWSPDGTKIVFGSNRSGSYTIWMKDLQTGVLSQITSVDGGDYPIFSPAGNRLAYFKNEYIYIRDLTSGETTLVENNSDWWSLSWSPDSSSIAFVSYKNGFGDIYTYNVNTKTRVQVTNLSSNDLYYPVWSSDGESILFEQWYSATAEDSLGFAPAHVAGVTSYVKEHIHIYTLDRTRSGYIIYVDLTARLLNKISLNDGQFTFRDILLHSGENVFTVTATDATGNESQSSDPISITYIPPSMPDLVAIADNIYMYPPLPIAGQQMSVNAVITNAGQIDASNVDVAMYLWNALGQMELLSSVTITAMLAGTSTVVSAVWNSMSKTDQNRIVVVVDPYDAIVETDESNNMAIKDFIVSAQAGITMSTALDSNQYGSNQNVMSTVNIWNNGDKTSGALNVQIEDESGALVTSFNAINATLSYGQVQSYPFTWNTGSTYAGLYKVRSVLTGTAGILSENTTTFTIVPDANLDLVVSTGKCAYGPGENVVTGFTIKNTGDNYIISTLQAIVSISDVTGTILFSDVKNISNLMPRSSVDLSSSWNTGLTAPGSYNATVTVLFDGGPTTTKSAAFTINALFVLTGTVTASPSVVPLGNAEQLTYTVSNSGNTDALGYVARISIIDPETQVIVQSQDQPIDIAENTGKNGMMTVSTNGFSLKTYTALLQLVNQGATKNIASASFTVKDLMPPVVTIASPAANGSYNSTMILSVLAVDNASGINKVEYQIDSGQWNLLPLSDPTQGRYTTTWNPAVTDNGGHIVSFRATDKAGNTSSPVSVGFTVQMNTPPVGGIVINNGAKYTNSPAVTLTLSCTSTTSGCAQMSFSSDAAVWSAPDAYEATKSWPLVAGGGTNTVYVRYIDGMGITSAAYSACIILDTTAPVLTLSTLPDGAYTNTATLNIAGTATDNIALQGVTINGTAVTVNADGIFSQAITLISGTNTIATLATDMAGNPTTDTRKIILDQKAPLITIANPADNSVVSNPSVTVSGMTDKAATIFISLNSGPTVTAATNATTFSLPVTLATNTVNTIFVYATDLAGNPGVAKRTVTHDDTNPALAITVPNQDMGTNQANITISGIVSDLTNVTMLVTSPTASIGIVSTPTLTTWSVNITNMQQGTNTYTVQATDQAGNSTSVARNIIYSQTPVTIDPVKTPTNTNQQQITGTMELNSTVTISCSTAAVGTIISTTTTWKAIIYNMIEGANIISATAIDLEGHVSDTVTATIVLDTLAPDTNILTGPATLTNQNTASFGFTSTKNGSTFECKIDQGSYEVCTTPANYDNRADGTHTFFVRATDPVGNTDQTPASFTWKVDTVPPIAVIIGAPPSLTNMRNASLTVAGDDVIAYQYNLDFGVFSADTSTSTPIELSGLLDGTHKVLVVGKDSAGNWQKPENATPASWTVDITPPELIVSTLPDGSYTNNPVLNIAGTANDENGIQSVVVSSQTVTPSTTDDVNYIFSQAISLTTGSNIITTVVTDNAGNAAIDTRTVILDQTAPQITITNPADNSISNQISSTVTGTVDKTATVSVTVNGISPGPSIVSDAIFSFPVSLIYGQNTIQVTAKDQAGNAGTAKRTVTLDNQNPSLSVTYPAEDMTTSQNQITLTGQVSDLTPITVAVAVDGNVYMPAVVNGSFAQTVSFAVQKTYQMDVTAVDEAGNQSLVQRNVIYNAIPQNFGVFGATGVSISGSYVDSYDSTQGAYYGVHGSNVSVGTNSTANGAINLSGGAAVYGDVYAGPGGDPAKAITTSGGAVIYGTEGALSVLKGMAPASDPGGGTSVSFKNGTTLTSGTYRVSSINLSGSGIGTINGKVTLFVTGSLNLSGGAQIVILPGGSLTVYLNGKLNVSGGSIVNETLSPHNLTIYGTATCSTANYSGNSAFYGVIYAPAAKTMISGGDDIYGSVIGSSVSISGGAAVHYDDSLGNVGR